MSGPPSTATGRGPSQTDSLVGVLSGGGRAFASQFLSFYMRVPIKLFRPARVDYSLLLRHSVATPATAMNGPYNFWTHSNIALLYQAIRSQGWRYIPDKLMPPIIANSAVGAVLYTTYLSSLSIMQFMQENQFPTFKQTVIAGGIAGAAQALVATPFDALAIRFDGDILRDKDISLWRYGSETLWKIGPRAAYGGIMLNVIKESSSFAAFFSVYEFVKGPIYRSARDWWLKPGFFHPEGRRESRIMYPTFVLLGGCAAAAVVQFISFPLTKVQRVFTLRLQAIDAMHRSTGGIIALVDQGWHFYAQAYSKTFKQVRRLVQREANGNWFRWFYSGSLSYAVASMPSTSIGLLVFEILRIRLSDTVDPRSESLRKGDKKSKKNSAQSDDGDDRTRLEN